MKHKLKQAAAIALASLELFLGARAVKAEDGPIVLRKKEPTAQVESVSPRRNLLEGRNFYLPVTKDLDSLVNNYTAEGLGKVTYSADELIGVGGDFLRNQDLTNKNPLTRFFLGVLPSTYFKGLTQMASHYIGHAGKGKELLGENFDWRFEGKSDPFLFCGYRSWKIPLTADQELEIESAGFNQNEVNATQFYEEDRDGGVTIDEALSFLPAKLYDVAYSPLLSNQRRELEGDIKRISKLTDMPKRDFILQSIASAALTKHTWDSLWSLGNYVIHGKKKFESRPWNVFGVKVDGPNTEQFLTRDGIFFRPNFLVNPDGEHQFNTNVAFGTHTYPGKDNQAIFGVEYKGPKINNIEISPNGSLSTKRGYSVGAKVKLPLINLGKSKGRIGVSLDARYSTDLINETLGRKGFSGIVNIGISYQ